MANPEQPQLYLITPPQMELSSFPDQLAGLLDSFEVACVRLAPASRNEDQIARMADALREVAHERDVALVIQEHGLMVERLGLDGVHLLDGPHSVRTMRKALGKDAIVGAFCGASRHDGMTAAEAGADYVAFGPVGETALGNGTRPEMALFTWWSEMIEVPVVAEGNLDEETISSLSEVTDFIAIGDEIWRHEDPARHLQTLLAALA